MAGASVGWSDGYLLGVPVDYAVLPRKRAVATVLFTDVLGGVLVVKPTYKPGWELPGGAVEDGESPGRAAVREVAEELGMQVPLGHLLAVDYVPSVGARTEGVVVVFDGGVLEDSARIRLAADELSEWTFAEPARLGGYLPALQHRRAVAAVRARGKGQALYLENGHPL